MVSNTQDVSLAERKTKLLRALRVLCGEMLFVGGSN